MPHDNSATFSPASPATHNEYMSGGIRVAAPNGTVNIGATANEHCEALKKLNSNSAPDALHTSIAVSRQGICTPGTRTMTIELLNSLAMSSGPTSPDIVWMHGPAGAGKSTIARTLASALERKNLLLASFFFLRSESKRNTSHSFTPTLALQAWDLIPATRTSISSAIQNKQHLFSQRVHFQFHHLLKTPLIAGLDCGNAHDDATTSTPFTILVDGLDECTDVGGQTEIVKAIGDLASSIRSHTKRRIKIFVISCPEYDIESAFDTLSSNENVTIVPLNSSDANIRLFYDEQFNRIRRQHRLTTDWPSQIDIECLTRETHGQYAFAGISTGFIGGGNPTLRLQIVRDALEDTNLYPLEPLDRLYTAILSQIPPQVRSRVLLVLRCQQDRHWRTQWDIILEPLLQLYPGEVQALAQDQHLSPLMISEGSLKPRHKSLVDFLSSSSRSGKASLHVDDGTLFRSVQNGIIALLSGDDLSNPSSSDYEATLFLDMIEREGVLARALRSPLLPDQLNQLKRIDPSQITIGSSLLLSCFLERPQKPSESRCFTVYGLLLFVLLAIVYRSLHLEIHLHISTTPQVRS